MNRYFHSLTCLFSAFYKKAIHCLRRINIFKRLIISSLIIILIPNLIIAFLSYDKFAGEMDSVISSHSYVSLKNFDKSISEKLDIYEYQAHRLYMNQELKELLRKCNAFRSNPDLSDSATEEYEKNKQAIRQMLHDISASVPSIANIEIVSEQDEFPMLPGSPQRSLIQIKDLDAFRQSDYYKRALDAFYLPLWWDTSNESHIYFTSDHVPAHVANYITLLRTIPEPASDGYLGVIVINVSLNLFNSMLSNGESLRKGENIILLSDSGIIRYFFMGPHFIQLDHSDIRKILTLDTENMIMKSEGENYLVSAVKSSYTDWTICSLIPRNTLLQSVYEIRNLVFTIGILCVIFAFFTSYLVNISIASPIRRLKNAMDKIDEANIEISYTDDIQDEIGILGMRFNSMINRIKNLINTVYEAELIKKEERIQRQEAELDALQMQINPHFLYNTLDIIRWQVMTQENGEGKASRMIDSFSRLLRLGTKRSSGIVPLQEEITHIKAYIEVVRFDLDFQLDIDFQIEGPITEYGIPKFTLQPLVENAIVHGFSKNRRYGIIRIHAYRKGNDFYIEVTDNGHGISPDMLDSLKKGIHSKRQLSKGIGLKNVNDRIKLYYGEQYGLDLKSRPEEYTRVILHLPVPKQTDTGPHQTYRIS